MASSLPEDKGGEGNQPYARNRPGKTPGRSLPLPRLGVGLQAHCEGGGPYTAEVTEGRPSLGRLHQEQQAQSYWPAESTIRIHLENQVTGVTWLAALERGCGLPRTGMKGRQREMWQLACLDRGAKWLLEYGPWRIGILHVGQGRILFDKPENRRKNIPLRKVP